MILTIFFLGAAGSLKETLSPTVQTKEIYLHYRIQQMYLLIVIVLFKSLRNSERRNKGNFMSKSN